MSPDVIKVDGTLDPQVVLGKDSKDQNQNNDQLVMARSTFGKKFKVCSDVTDAKDLGVAHFGSLGNTLFGLF